MSFILLPQKIEMIGLSPNPRPIAIDLFAGAGGMSLGFEQAGFDIRVAVEIDPIHACTHHYNFPYTKVLCRSVEQVNGAEIREAAQIGDRDLDVILSGSPCQGFSIMGKRALDDPRNSLLIHFHRLVEELKPKYFVMENVRGLTIGEHKQLLDGLIEAFQAIGYQVNTQYQILNAAHYGVPQARERLFLLGCRQDCQLPQYPAPITQVARPQPLKHPKKKLAHLPVGPTVWDALQDLPEAENYEELLHQDWVKARYNKPSLYGEALHGCRALTDDYSYTRIYNRQLLTSSIRTQHGEASRNRFAQTEPGKREPTSRFHKLHPQGVCITLRAGTDRDRGSFTSPRPIHPHTPRCITVREAARLHSYPDWFRFHATKWHGFRQVGNSVPPLLAKAVAGEIRRALGISVTQPSRKLKLGNEHLLQGTLVQALQYVQKLD